MTTFDPLAAYHYTARLCQPRLVRTRGEIEARQFILDLLRQNNLPVKETWFTFYPGFAFSFLKIALAFILLLLLVQMILLRSQVALATLVGLGIPAAALLLKRAWEYFERNMHIDFTRRFPFMRKLAGSTGIPLQTSNIEAALPAGEKARGIVYLTAHYDSKSQNLSIPLRIIFAATVYAGIFLLPLVYLIALLFPNLWGTGLFRFLTFLLFVATFIAGYLLTGLTVENRSPGAIDNGASCGMLLALATMWAGQATPPFQNLDVRIVFTGAEELGLAGATELTRQNRDRWDKERAAGKDLFFLNFDGIGMSKKHTLTAATSLLSGRGHGSDPLLHHVITAANRLGLPIKHLRGILGGEADHIPFVQAGLPAVSIGSVSSAVRFIHTEHDTLDNVDPEALAATANLLLEILNSLDGSLKK